MATKDTVLETMKQAGTPLNAGKIAELSGLDRKEVDKAMKELSFLPSVVNGNRHRSKPTSVIMGSWLKLTFTGMDRDFATGKV